MKTIIGISRSLRQAVNSALLAVAAQVMRDGISLQIASIRGIPLYDGDVEAAEGVPSVVHELEERIAAADGLLIATPEYG